MDSSKTKKRPSILGEKLGRDVFFGTSEALPRIVELNLEQITPNPEQPRKDFNPERLRELADSIASHGLIQPITVKENGAGPGMYLLVAGERRYRAHKLIGKSTIAAIITHGSADELALIENIQREDLNPIEAAEALQNMMERHRYTQTELGKVIGKAVSTVNEYLRLNALAPEIKTEFRTSENISRNTLLEIAKLPTREEQLALWDIAKQGGLTVKKARLQKADANGTSAAKHPATVTLENGRRFMRVLEALTPAHLAEDRDAHLALVTLRQELNAILDDLFAALPEPGTRTVRIPVQGEPSPYEENTSADAS